MKWRRVHAIRRAAGHLNALQDDAQLTVIQKLYKMSELVTQEVADSILRTLNKVPPLSYSPVRPESPPSPVLRPVSPEVIVVSDSDTASADNATPDNPSADNTDNATDNTDNADNDNADQAPRDDGPPGAPLQVPRVAGLYRNHRHFNSHIDAQRTLTAMGFGSARTTALLRELIEVDADEVLQFAIDVLIAEAN